MAQGFQAFDAQGRIVVDVTTRLARYITGITISPANGPGSYTVPNLYGTDELYYSLSPAGEGSVQTTRQANITINGATISWTWSGVGQANTPYNLRILAW